MTATDLQLPLVSIMILSYNQEHFIAETLQSALTQNYSNLEVIVSDDASTDKTSEIIRHFQAQYPERLKPVFNSQNLGITGNCNRALQHCRGKYIAWLGGDDIMLPDKIRQQVECMENDPNIVITHHDVEVFDSATNATLYYASTKKSLTGAETNIRDLIGYGFYMMGPSVMLRTDCVPKRGFDERIKVSSDWLFLLQCMLSKPQGKIVYLNGVYVRYRRHQKNLTIFMKQNLKMSLDEHLLTLDILAVEAEAFHPEIKSAKFYLKLIFVIRFALAKQYTLSLKTAVNSLPDFSISGLIIFFKKTLQDYQFKKAVKLKRSASLSLPSNSYPEG
ncbi:MAG: glycosyltransferase [Gammaproteobacteria bacterium]